VMLGLVGWDACNDGGVGVMLGWVEWGCVQ